MAATSQSSKRRVIPWVVHLLAALALLAFVLLLYARLLFTNQVLASGDILHYFYPYRDYAAAAVRAGRVPLWNPYIFLGAPFLANPQSAVLYPLHWPLSWLPVTKQIYWSAALHTWILGLGGYALMRRWGYGAVAGLVTSLVLAGSGFYGGLLGHINQMNGAAWLPWAAWTLEMATDRASRARAASRGIWPSLLTSAALFALLTALMLLAGHTQTVYINLFGLGVWTVWPLVSPALWRRPRTLAAKIWPPLAIYAAGVILGTALSAAQLLPTLEVSVLGLRSGGLSYAEASSFSLKPLHILWTLLPSYGLADLSVVFDTLGYTEFVAYVGLMGLILTVLGGWKGRGRARAFGLLFAILGLFLAAGRWNPAYFLLYKLVPGFDLFRAPARWIMLYTLGAAALAGVGVQWIENSRLKIEDWTPDQSSLPANLPIPQSPRHLIFNLQSLILILILIFFDLLLAARAMPHAQTTAPQAVYDLRTAPTHLLTDPLRATLGPAAAGRFLSMSALTFDPGDMADYRRIFADGPDAPLDEQAFEQLIIAQKSQEILAPNLPLLWRVPAVDGFDGGVLPLQRYIRALSLFAPAEEVVPDGRLREQIRQVPDAGLLGLLNVQYVITDKVRDLWYNDVYYDRQIGARLDAGLEWVSVDAPLPFEATHIDLIGYVDGTDEALAGLADVTRPVATVDVVQDGALRESLTVTAGGAPGADFADGVLDSPMAATGGAEVAYRDVEGGRQEYLVRLPLTTPLAPDELVVARVEGGNEELTVIIQAATLFDERTGMFLALLPSDRGRFALVHSGDVKVYENLDVAPRAYMAYDWTVVDDADAALALVRERRGQAVAQPVVEGALPASMQPAPGATGEAEIIAYAPERVTVRVSGDQPGLLVLSDSNYPGWRAWVDGAPVELLNINYLFRGVPVTAGKHAVVFEFRSDSWRRGLETSGGALLLWIGILFAGLAVDWRRAKRNVQPVGRAGMPD